MPLVCKGGLMFLKFQGIPTDKDLQTYPSVHLTCMQEWDPSVLDYVYPEDNGEPDWTNDPTQKLQFDPKFDESGDRINKSLSIAPQISSVHNLLVNKHTTQWGVTFDFFSKERHLKIWNPQGKFPHDPGGRTNESTHEISAKDICNLNWIHLYDEKQFTFLQERSNRILSKLKSFWSCSHMNYCLHYMLHINLHIIYIYIYFIQMNLNLKEIQESNKNINSYQENKIEFIVG